MWSWFFILLWYIYTTALYLIVLSFYNFSSRFATIRSAQVIHRQLYEHNEDNHHREQLLGYKRMRQQHQKQLINYEQKLKNEMDEYRYVSDLVNIYYVSSTWEYPLLFTFSIYTPRQNERGIVIKFSVNVIN